MSRQVGSVGKKTLEYVQAYDSMISKYGDPIEVLFRLMQSRKHSIKFQAAKELMSYRYPKQMAARMELETAGQIVMQWEDTLEKPPGIESKQPPPIDVESTTIKDDIPL